MTESIINSALDFISTAGYPGIFALMMAEAIVVPIPVELTMIFSGFLTATGRFDTLTVIIVGIVANLTGSTIAYFAGYHFKKRVIEDIVKDYGKFLLITQAEFKKAEDIFSHHGVWIIAVTRLLPGIRSFISLISGLMKMPYRIFILISLLTATISSTAFTLIGSKLGDNWQSFTPVLKKFDLITISSIIILTALFLAHKLKSAQKT